MNESINNFENLIEVTGRDFDRLQVAMVQISVPAAILQIGIKPSGLYYAILNADRPKKSVTKDRKQLN